MTKCLIDKVILVTGAGSGIGKACALDIANEGGIVICADSNETTASETAKTITHAGGQAYGRKLDVTLEEDHSSVISEILDKYGRLDGALNNAGIIGTQALLADIKIEEWNTVLAVNLTGVFLGMQSQIKAFLKIGKPGAIVNMGSIHSVVCLPMIGTYGVTKHALIGLTKTAALDYAKNQIRVNAIGPAYVDTPLINNNPALAKEKNYLSTLHPIGRLARADEISPMASFLLSDKASFITGSFNLIDGGYTAQ